MNEMAERPGVSIVICCHNSGDRLLRALGHLLKQKNEPKIAWEVLIIDNASTDQTAQLALAYWPKDFQAPLKVVKEPRPGLAFARQTGLKEAAYEFVSFVDDDNGVFPGWIRLVYETLLTHPGVGACGGLNEPVFEKAPPSWLGRYQLYLALGPSSTKALGEAHRTELLFGAGLTLRKSAWKQMVHLGWTPLVMDRQGSLLTGGNDNELCYMLRILGWELWCNPRLELKHYIPAQRLSWKYMRHLFNGQGISGIDLEPYAFVLHEPPYLKGPGAFLWLDWGFVWLRRLCERFLWLLKNFHHVLKFFFLQKEGDPDVLSVELALGQLSGLFRNIFTYTKKIKKIRALAAAAKPCIAKSEA